MNPEELLHAACVGRGWLMSGGRPDETRGAAVVLDEFRAGKAGRITLERPEKPEKAGATGESQTVKPNARRADGEEANPEDAHGEGETGGEADPHDGD
jgi:ribosome biogenesis GTPase A